MLYDQALLAIAYTETYQATGKDEYARTAREILAYVARDMTAPSGGFYSAEDAESEGEEGKFYTWSWGEVREVLSREEADLAVAAFGIEKTGNFLDDATGRRTGANIPYRALPLSDLSAQWNLPEAEIERRIEEIRAKLLAVRSSRVRPRRDDKMLADWNGLMMAAFAKGAQVFGDEAYAEAARRASQFVLGHMRASDGRLLHRWRDGEAGIKGYLDDYAFLVWGLLELYEATCDVTHLRAAIALNGAMLDRFWDEAGGGCFFTANDAEQTLVRMKQAYDGAVPSGNSVAMLNLLRLARMTARPALEEKAAELGRAFSLQVEASPRAYTQLLAAVDFACGPSYEVVVAGDSRVDDTREMLRAVRTPFVPNKVLILRPTEEPTPEIVSIAEFTKEHVSLNGKATAYVCAGQSCRRPTTKVNELRELLRKSDQVHRALRLAKPRIMAQTRHSVRD